MIASDLSSSRKPLVEGLIAVSFNMLSDRYRTQHVVSAFACQVCTALRQTFALILFDIAAQGCIAGFGFKAY